MIVKWTTGVGITGTKKAKAWSYQKYDDFFIVENIFEYTGDSNGDGVVTAEDVYGTDLPVLTDVYFAFGNMFSSSLMGECWGDDPYYGWGDLAKECAALRRTITINTAILPDIWRYCLRIRKIIPVKK